MANISDYVKKVESNPSLLDPQQSIFGAKAPVAAIDRAKVGLKLLSAFDTQPKNEMSDELAHVAVRYASQLVEQLERIQGLATTQMRASQIDELDDASKRIESVFGTIVKDIRPQLQGATTTLADAVRVIERGEQAARDCNAASTAAESLVTELREAAAESASTKLAKHYQQLSDRSRNRSYVALVGGVIGIAIAALLLIWLFVTNEPVYPGSGGRVAEYVTDVGRRLIAVSATLYLGLFCIRLFRTYEHLRLVSLERVASLDTFPLLVGAVESPTARDVIVAELVRQVFAHPNTGLVGSIKDEADSGPAVLLGALAGKLGKQ